MRHTNMDLALRSTVAVHDPCGALIGTGTVVATNQVLTALHVVNLEPTILVTCRDHPHAVAVHATATLPLRKFGPIRPLAARSYQRFRALTGEDLGTVDLALLNIPDLPTPPVPIRNTPPRHGEVIVIAGYPGGQWAITAGPITATDNADFIAHLLLGPGASGAPAIDHTGNLIGLTTLDHPTVGLIAIGPALITAFLDGTSRLLSAATRRARPSGMTQPLQPRVAKISHLQRYWTWGRPVPP